MRVLLALLVTMSAANAGPIDDAMKKIGPAYMCGPPYAFDDALTGLRNELRAAGLSDMLASFTIDGLRAWVEKEHAKTRAKITAAECKSKYNAD